MATELKTIEIDQIIVQSRIREELGNIDTLAKSIGEYGLIFPILLNKKNILLSGLRRLEACKKLGFTKIETLVSDIDNEMDIFNIESQENLCRKGLTPVELDKVIEIKKRYAYGRVGKTSIFSRLVKKVSRIFKRKK